jgi:hypothetical protein
MTEPEWHGCEDSTAMVEFLQCEFLKGRFSERKMRLFACGWARAVFFPSHALAAIEAAERFADGQGTRAEMSAASAALAARPYRGAGWEYVQAGWFAALAACAEPAEHALSIDPSPIAMLCATPADKVAMCCQLREVFGNPFRPIAVSPSWLDGNAATVRKIAQGIYDDRAFHWLPVLADALEEADCTDSTMLAHCRGPAEHVRGCWAIDLLLGKT